MLCMPWPRRLAGTLTGNAAGSGEGAARGPGPAAAGEPARLAAAVDPGAAAPPHSSPATVRSPQPEQPPPIQITTLCCVLYSFSYMFIGQLVREKYGDRALNIGFSTSRGKVTAATDWDGPAEAKTIRDPLPDSYEDVFSQLEKKRFFFDLRASSEAVGLLSEERLQRAIGVIYRPETERVSHYFYSSLPLQFDFMIHVDETTAVQPLPSFVHGRAGEMDETYPSGF